MKPDCILSSHTRSFEEYARIKYQGRSELHHRVVFAAANNVPLAAMKGYVVMHSCDTPGCVNPKHLQLGTHKDNMADCLAKNRQAHKPLSPSLVAYIRKSTAQCRPLAAELGISRQTISNVRNKVKPYDYETT